ncbi:MAG TPA: M23 family metallopeptidase [Mobilitalea sp.]|nr:M23 family metallopeptidase [Mobilitalea sp.]
MNKNRFTEFFKGKGYYVLLFVGVLAIAAVAIVGSQLSSNSKDKDQNYVNLNDTQNNDLAATDGDTQLAENNPVTESGVANNEGNSTDSAVTNEDANAAVESNSDQVEYEDYTDGTTTSTDQAQATDQSGTTTASQDTGEAAVETTGNVVETDTNSIADNLSFKADDGLLWPVEGNVIMNYSMDHTIYFATLMQYKCNPAIIFGAEVGTEVKAAAKGVVTKIEENNAETGFTITMNIGNGYSLVYGQLDKESVTLEVGDTVDEGDVIGTVGEPTKYYSVEGSNLYFQVLEDDQTVNPMLLLR